MIRLQKYSENSKLPNIFLFLDILFPKLNKIKAAKPLKLRRLSDFPVLYQSIVLSDFPVLRNLDGFPV